MRIEYIRSRKQYASVGASISKNEDIVLVGINCPDKGVETIFEALQKNTKVLGVRYLNFKPDGTIAAAIGKFLASNKTVKTFELGLAPDNPCTDEIIRSLLDIVSAFNRNRSITSFRIENFVIKNDADAIDAFTFMISKSNQLQVLSFFNCQISPKELKTMARGIQENPAFRMLRVQDQFWHVGNVNKSGIITDLRGIIDERRNNTVIRYTYFFL